MAVEQTRAAPTTTQLPTTTGLPTDDTGNSGPPHGPMIDMARIDGPAVQGYADKHGVTPEQAREIIIWQAEVNQQLARVTSVAGPRYAGARFLPPEENGGEAIVAIYIADPTAEDIAAVAKLDGSILVEAIGGMEELDQIVAEAAAVAQAEHPDAWVSVVIDPATGEVEVSYDYPVLDE